ncbi:MAG TPA: anti-sigma factor [Steroidobacteraceae bacterium]|nr:anti-sigma factor [Steroidobacteraceae bacterium]
MNERNRELIDRLASEYVLGTLRGAARRRFESLSAKSGSIASVVRRWEDRFLGLAPGATAAQPSQRVWTGILREIDEYERTKPRDSTRRAWTFALAAGLVGLVVAVGWYRYMQEPPPGAVAIFTTTAGGEIWRVEASKDTTSLRMATLGPVPLEAGRSFELWALPEGGNPVSLGLMPTAGSASAKLTAEQRAALLASRKLAISLEPVGGSPTGSPTGPVVHAADWVIGG